MDIDLKQFKTILDIIEFGSEKLSNSDLFFYHGTNNAYDECVSIVSYVLCLDLTKDNLDLNDKLTIDQAKQIIKCFEKRLNQRKPAPYITNIAYFCGRKFYIDERAMIPTSPFAELIANRFSPWMLKEPNNILELCTGSGALAISIAYEFTKSNIDAIDISDKALDVASKNIEIHEMDTRVNLISSDLFTNVSKKYDLIIANPPYVDYEEYFSLPKEFTYEPKQSFVAKNQGMEIVERILQQASNFLKENGIIFVEVGYNSSVLEEHFPSVPFTWVELYKGGEGIFMLPKEELDKHFK